MENSKKQTAVEWLVETIQKQIDAGYGFSPKFEEVIVCQAKEMEKQQIIDAGNSCALKQHLHSDRITKMSESQIRKFAEEEHLTFGEEYYKETFNE